MEDDNKDLYAIDTIVEDFMADEGLTHHDYFKLQRWALRAVRETHFNIKGQPITEVIEMDDKRRVMLPLDYVDWLLIGIKTQGRIKILTVNNNILVNNAVSPPEVLAGDVNSWPSGTDFNNYGGFYFYNNSGQDNFGYYGRNFSGYCKVFDGKHPKHIQFTSEVNKQPVWVQYISDGLSLCGQTYVHPYMAKYIRLYMAHEYEKRRSGKTESSIYRAATDLADAETELRAMQSDLTVAAAYSISNKTQRLTTNG